MKGIIYVAHGSQKADKNQMMLQFYQQLKRERHEKQQGLAFLEKHPDSLTNVAETMIQQGVNHLLVVPLLLFSAKHKEEDIVNELALIKEKHPEITTVACDTFGQEPEVLDVLVARIKHEQENRALSSQTPVLLIAHGSSTYPKPGKLVARIAEELSQRSGFKVSVGLLYGGERYAEKAESLLESHDQLIIVPFFLFDGHLLDKINRTISASLMTVPATKEVYYTATLNLDRSMTKGILRLMEGVSLDD